jgi:bifunctional DNase/RNase
MKMAAPAAVMSLVHSHACVGFLHKDLDPCSFGSARTQVLSRPPILGGVSRCVPAPAGPRVYASRSSTRRNSSQSFNNGSMAENFSENDEDYVDASVVEALEVRSGPDGFIIKMRDGNVLKCLHNKTEGGKLPVYAAQPAIVLQLNDGSNLLLPIIVLELPSVMLLEAVRNVQVTRPTVYQVMSKMLEVSGYTAKVVRVTKRVNEAYFARIYLAKYDDDTAPPVSLDVRPSDAINFAVRCKIPIQVCNTVFTVFLFAACFSFEFYVDACEYTSLGCWIRGLFLA